MHSSFCVFQFPLRRAPRLRRERCFPNCRTFRTPPPPTLTSPPPQAAGPHQPCPAPLSPALSAYTADHPVGQARLPPPNALRGSPGRGLRAPASSTPHPSTPTIEPASRPPGGARRLPAPLRSKPSQLSLQLAGRLESCAPIGYRHVSRGRRGGPR